MRWLMDCLRWIAKSLAAAGCAHERQNALDNAERKAQDQCEVTNLRYHLISPLLTYREALYQSLARSSASSNVNGRAAAGEGAAQFVLCRCSESNGTEQLRSAKNNVP